MAITNIHYDGSPLIVKAMSHERHVIVSENVAVVLLTMDRRIKSVFGINTNRMPCLRESRISTVEESSKSNISYYAEATSRRGRFQMTKDITQT